MRRSRIRIRWMLSAAQSSDFPWIAILYSAARLTVVRFTEGPLKLMKYEFSRISNGVKTASHDTARQTIRIRFSLDRLSIQIISPVALFPEAIYGF
jgi:hypothetical protein